MLATLKTPRPKKHVHWDIEDCECGKLKKAHELDEPTQHRPRFFNINFWFLTTALLLAFLIVQNIRDLRSRGLRSYENTFNTDFPDTHRTVGLERRRFISSLRDFPNGTLYMVSDASQRQYVGLPSPAIDENWDALTHGRMFTTFTTPPTNHSQDVTSSLPRLKTPRCTETPECPKRSISPPSEAHSPLLSTAAPTSSTTCTASTPCASTSTAATTGEAWSCRRSTSACTWTTVSTC